MLFISLLLHLKNETVSSVRSIRDYEIDDKIVKIFQELESLTFSIYEPLKGLEFRNKVLAKLCEVKIAIRNENETMFNRIVCSLVAAVILNKNQQIRWEISRNMIENISKVRDDSGALFVSYIMQSLMAYDNENKGIMRLAIDAKMKDKSLRRFRKTLYEDVLRAT